MFARGLKTTVARGVRLNSSTSTPAKVNAITSATTTNKELCSGAPSELANEANRVVRIYKEAKYATQSAHGNGKYWRLEFDILSKGNRWENDLMGFQSSSDYMHASRLNFDTKEAAVRFADGQGWDYYVQEPKERKIKPKQYAANFVHSYGPLKFIRTK